MTSDSKPRIRKVWLPTELKGALEELCWEKRTKPSPFIVKIITNFLADPKQYGGLPVPPAGKDYASVYISDDVWIPAVDLADSMGTRLSAVVRAAIADSLNKNGIPWDVTTPRPKNEHIPIRE